MAANAAVAMILRISISSLCQQLLQGIATAATIIMGVRHGAGGAAGLPRSIEVYALPGNCAIERNEAGSVFDGARQAGAAHLSGSSSRSSVSAITASA
jgi:hypothetical protein